ncbi:DUF4364 family protein [Ruminococcaceae bacterium OttesenSCG-928-N02]|nr:DUF4364 family protein [Ruminococcaceae bacterium OttesenSCG-928-N02]
MSNFAFTGGVKLGGLTSTTEIRVLLCYLLGAVDGGLTQAELDAALLGEELANYFEYANALSALCENGMVTLADGTYTVTAAGREVALTLEDELPTTVKEQAVAAVVAAQRFAQKEKQNRATTEKLAAGGYMVHCRIAEETHGDATFAFSIFMPDKLSAEHVKRRFTEHGEDIFKTMLYSLTEDL